MKIPKYWARGQATVQDLRGRELKLSCWRWSDVSQVEAAQAAEAHARDITQRFAASQRLDRYAYADRPLREEIVEPLTEAGGREAAIITRNSYGTLVLNTARIMFIDIDFEKKDKSGLLAGRLRLLGGKPSPSPEAQQLGRIEDWARQHPQWSIRVYRTYGGLRGLITNELFEPTDAASIEVLESLNSDPLYVRLCKAQECFRARLTPKPWRCGVTPPPSRYPWPTSTAEMAQRQWERNYEYAANRYTTCQLVKELGAQTMHPEIARIVAIHDQYACRGDGFDLA
jgi:hypothetical protein